MAFSVAEDELRGMDTSALVGHLAAWNYFQSVDTPQNKKFVASFKAYCKKNNLPDGENRVTDDPIEAAYFGVYVWKQAVEKAGTTDVDKVRAAVYNQKFLAPGGTIMMDCCNQHTHKPVIIGEISKMASSSQSGGPRGWSSQSPGASSRIRRRAVTGSVIRARIKRSKTAEDVQLPSLSYMETILTTDALGGSGWKFIRLGR